jgi:hypothetical protein
MLDHATIAAVSAGAATDMLLLRFQPLRGLAVIGLAAPCGCLPAASMERAVGDGRFVTSPP